MVSWPNFSANVIFPMRVSIAVIRSSVHWKDSPAALPGGNASLTGSQVRDNESVMMAKSVFPKRASHDTRTTGRRSHAVARPRGDRATGPWAAIEDGDGCIVGLPGSQHAALAGDGVMPRHHRHGVRPDPPQRLESAVLRCLVAAEHGSISPAARGF